MTVAHWYWSHPPPNARYSGSSLFDRSGDEFELHVGCLDAPSQLTPTYESWVVRREAWLPAFDVANRYEHDRTAKGRTEP